MNHLPKTSCSKRRRSSKRFQSASKSGTACCNRTLTYCLSSASAALALGSKEKLPMVCSFDCCFLPSVFRLRSLGLCSVRDLDHVVPGATSRGVISFYWQIQKLVCFGVHQAIGWSIWWRFRLQGTISRIHSEPFTNLMTKQLFQFVRQGNLRDVVALGHLRERMFQSLGHDTHFRHRDDVPFRITVNECTHNHILVRLPANSPSPDRPCR